MSWTRTPSPWARWFNVSIGERVSCNTVYLCRRICCEYLLLSDTFRKPTSSTFCNWMTYWFQYFTKNWNYLTDSRSWAL
jgi:hypothetical protein